MIFVSTFYLFFNFLLAGNDVGLAEHFRVNPSVPVYREFWTNQNCPELQFGSKNKREYLVIGQGGLKIQDKNGQDR